MILPLAHLLLTTPVMFHGKSGNELSATATAIRNRGHVVITVAIVNVSKTNAEFNVDPVNLRGYEQRDGVDVPGSLEVCTPFYGSYTRTQDVPAAPIRLRPGEATTVVAAGPAACAGDFALPGHYAGVVRVILIHFQNGVKDESYRENFQVPWQADL